ncbi:MAG: PD-(D/E)XK nuclease family protein [Clostridia bacterium]|nr:PD-(D/E)XK nuclease family protein [Clostridia bacterium]
MSVTFFTGRKALLRPRLLKEVEKALLCGDDKNVVILVPEQLTLETEMLTLEGLSLSGSFRLSVLSPKRFAGLIFDEAGRDQRVLVDERGRAMLMGKTLRNLNKKLKWYQGAKEKRGFEMRIVDQISRLKQAGVTPDALLTLSEEKEDSAIKWKLYDVARLYQKYEEEIADRFQDGEDEINEAIKRMENAPSVKNARIFAFGFDLTTPNFNKLFACAASVCIEAGVFLPLENDGMAQDFTLYKPLQASYERMLASLREKSVSYKREYLSEENPAGGAHKHFAREAYSAFVTPFEGKNTSFQMALLLNPLEEARFAAALIRRLVSKNHWRYSDIQVIVNDASAYSDALESAFEAYEVPIFLPESRPADRHPLPRFLMETLKILSGADGDLSSLITTGYTDLTDEEAEALLSYARLFGLNARSLLKPIKRAPEGQLEQIEEIRRKIADPILKLDSALSHADTLTEQLASVFLYLSELNCARKGEIQRQRLTELGERLLAAEDAQVWNRVVGTLDQMNELLGEKKLSKAMFTDLLARAFLNAEIKPLPQSQDAVNALSAARMGFKPVKALIVIGQTAGGAVSEEGLFDENETGELSQKLDVFLGPDALSKVRTERMYMKDALSLAEEYICITYPMSGIDGASLAPGVLVSEAMRIFPNLRVRGGVTDDEAILAMRYAAPQAAEQTAAVELSAGSLSESGKAALASASKIGGSAIDRIRRALTHKTESENIGRALSRQVYGALDKVSVTRLEAYAGCPFKHFVKYALRPEREEPFGLNAKDEGSFLHEAVCSFLSESRVDLNDISQQEAARRMNKISDNIIESALKDAMDDTSVAKASAKKLRRVAARAAKTLVEQLRNGAFAPMELEMEFGETGPVLRLNDQAKSRIAGRIDRVDAMKVENESYLRVIDYKRGSKKPDAGEMYYGLQLQLILYLASALKKYGGKSAGAFYFRVDDPIIQTDSLDEDEIEKMRLDRMRMEGILPSDPDLIRLMADEPEHVFKIRFLKDGTPDSRALTATDEEFALLMEHAMMVASHIASDIETGETRIEPAQSERTDACAYCEYKGVCMLDKYIPGSGAKKIKKLTFREMCERIRVNKRENSDQ